MKLADSHLTATQGPVINSLRGGSGRCLGGVQNSLHSEGEGVKNKEHF